MSMNKWEEKTREIAERVAAMNFDDDGEYASAFYKEIVKAITREEYPDEVKKITSIVGRPELVAFKRLDGEYEDAWGNKINTDSELVAVANLVGMSGGEGVWEFPITEEEARGRKYRFIAISPKEHEEVLREMERYIYTDTKDAKDTPIVFAVVPTGMKDNTPSSKWNEVAREMEHKRLKTMIDEAYEYEKRVFDELEIDGKSAFDMFFKEVVGVNAELEIRKRSVEEAKNMAEDESLVLERVKFPNGKYVDFVYLEDIIRAYIENRSEVLEYVREMNKLKQLRKNGGAKDIEVGVITNRRTRKSYLLMMENWKLRVPSNMVGIVIGKGGARIKKLEKLLGHKVEIVKTEPHDLGDGHLEIKFTGDIELEDKLLEIVSIAAQLRETARKEYEKNIEVGL